ncbi:MAG: NAD(P)H-hydrate dehydratase [Erysipelotrichaceae bacterium]|nr:NAD(P)H-hydrate dehydratase [Erysipelotrichaceae bacterium]
MYVGSQNLLKHYDECLLRSGYTIEELIDKASDCLYPHFNDYKKLAVFVGPGNNGGDGLSLACKVVDDHRDAVIYFIGDPSRFSKGNRYYFKECEIRGMTMIKLTDENINDLANDLKQFDVVVDAFFGFGLNSSPRGLYKDAIDYINQYDNGDVIAIDIPTGLSCNTGKPYQSCLYATKTIALTATKEGYLNPDSRIFTGEVIVETLDAKDVSEEAGLYYLFGGNDAKAIMKPRAYDGYKNQYGVDLLIVGSPQYRGAALMATRSCVNSGAGIVKVLSVPAVNNILPMTIPEAIGIERPMVLRSEDLNGYQAILLGCGIGLDIDADRLVEGVMTLGHAPLVIDADALTILSHNMKWLRHYDGPVILTPHIGEFKRLCPEAGNEDLMDVAHQFARRYHCILILKGPKTIVTDGHLNYRIDAGNGAMAVGGMGDTLAGILTALLGQGYDPLDAACLGVFIHGYAGDVIAQKSYTVLPDRLAEALPMIMKSLVNK